MKRIVICCDGTWNHLDTPNKTNVVKIAERVALCDPEDGTPQIVYYQSGVGTSVALSRGLNALFGGAFGSGLMNNVADAYRFLIFNYEVGDEIYIFGFSRGAYTARSLAGLIRNCGLPRREHATTVGAAIERYRSRAADARPDSPDSCAFRARYSAHFHTSPAELDWRRDNEENFDPDACPRFTIAYLGIWDTVGALGIPSHLPFSTLFNQRFRFHDQQLSSFVASARHAMALDERRRIFVPTPWSNMDEMNGDRLGREDAPYQQQWFPGNHGSVGGGGDVTGLSDSALIWIAAGAEAKGLYFADTFIDDLVPDHKAALSNVSAERQRGLRLLDRTLKAWREGPKSCHDISITAERRWKTPASELAEGRRYRPKSLRKVAKSCARLKD